MQNTSEPPPSTLLQLADQFRDSMVPVSSKFFYFPVAVTLSDFEIKENIEEPVASIPPALAELLPPVHLLLLPYLARTEPRRNFRPEELQVLMQPPEPNLAQLYAHFERDGRAVIALAVEQEQLSEHHYSFFNAVANLVADRIPEAMSHDYTAMLRDELTKGVHGEVDDPGWNLKISLLRHRKNPARDSKRFREYVRQSLIDTLTLYLHGICCDIDIEPSPRQLPSRYLRERLLLIHSTFPPPEGYAVFPEDQSKL